MVEGNVKRDTNTLITAHKVLALVNKIIKKKDQEGVPLKMTHFNMILERFKNTPQFVCCSVTQITSCPSLCVKYDIISGTYRYQTP